jgi:hypothetical protein
MGEELQLRRAGRVKGKPGGERYCAEDHSGHRVRNQSYGARAHRDYAEGEKDIEGERAGA